MVIPALQAIIDRIDTWSPEQQDRAGGRTHVLSQHDLGLAVA